MNVTCYFSQDRYHFRGYRPEHAVQRVFRYQHDVAATPIGPAAELFRACNAPLTMVIPDCRPLTRAFRAASLRTFSVGDVLQISGIWLACAATGWIELAQTPIEVSDG